MIKLFFSRNLTIYRWFLFLSLIGICFGALYSLYFYGAQIGFLVYCLIFLRKDVELAKAEKPPYVYDYSKEVGYKELEKQGYTMLKLGDTWKNGDVYGKGFEFVIGTNQTSCKAGTKVRKDVMCYYPRRK